MENVSFYRNLCSNFPLVINRCVPNYICRKSDVTYYKNGNICKLNIQTLLVNLQAIKQAMILANTYGTSTLSMGLDDNDIFVNIGITSLGYPMFGEVSKGLLKTKVRNREKDNPIWVELEKPRLIFHFYGEKDPYINTGYPIITQNVDCLLQSFKETIEYLSLRVKESFGAIFEVGGVDSDGEDAPVLQSSNDEILQNWRKNRELLLPTGSKYHEHEIALTDFDKVLSPIERGISVETGIPQWLIFTTVVSGQYELENRSEWAQSKYESEVLPVLAKLLEYQGYDLLDIETPSYRGILHNAEVKAMIADSEYKNSSTARNKQMTINLSKNPDAKTGNMGRKL